MTLYQAELKRKKIENEIAALNNMLEQEGVKTRYKLIEQTEDSN